MVIKGEGNIKKYGPEVYVSNPAEWLERIHVAEYHEPIVHGTIITPVQYLSHLLGNTKSTCS